MATEQHHPLSPSEVQSIAGKPISTFKYSELGDMTSIQDLFAKNNCVLLLYESKLNSGHWCCLINQPSQVVFFDPYSLEPDSQLAFSNIRFRDNNGMELPYLTYLMLKSQKPIDYNNIQNQRLSQGIETCGYHCGVRMRAEKLTNTEYNNIFKSVPLKQRDNLIIKLATQLNSA